MALTMLNVDVDLDACYGAVVTQVIFLVVLRHRGQNSSIAYKKGKSLGFQDDYSVRVVA